MGTPAGGLAPPPQAGRGLLPDEAAHLERCPTCSRQMTEYRETLRLLRLASVEPSPETVERILARARQEAGRDPIGVRSAPGQGLTGRVGEAIREIVATLIPMSLAPAAGVRGTSLDPRLPQVFDTDEYTVSLSVLESSDPGRIRLLGSLAPKRMEVERPGGVATIFCGNSAIIVPIDSDGEFEADHLEPGDLHMEIDLPGTRITISPIPAPHPARLNLD